MCDTLQVMADISSGKVPVSSPPDYHTTFDGPRLPQRDRQTFCQPPSHILSVTSKTEVSSTSSYGDASE